MNIRELKELISNGESERLEFKRSTGQRTEPAKAVCAMLNGLSTNWSEQAGSVFVTFTPAFGETTPQVTPQVMRVLKVYRAR